MLLIPAIDLKDGHCVRLKQGDMDQSTTFGEDPAAMARKWVDAGARRLHLVDLNGAFAGVPKNYSAIKSILKEVGEKFSRIITIEDGVRMGGMGSAVLEWMNDHDYQPKMTRMGLPDEFVEHGTVAQLREIVHLDKEAIKEAIKK